MTMRSNTWSLAQEITLIEFWKGKPCLWDPKHSNYYRKDQRKRTIQVVIHALGKDVNGLPFTDTSVKKKIKHLRDLLVRELKRVESSKKSDSASKYSSKWIHFNRLQYLRRTLKADLGIDNMESSMDSAEYCGTVASLGESQSSDGPSIVTETGETYDDDLLETTSGPSPMPVHPPRQKRHEPPSIKDAMFCKAIEVMNQTPANISSEDLFGMFVGNALKKFGAREQAQIKFDIHQILFNYEIGEER